jgi:glutathione synthase/RimK-type ligase-like ATP-grasp enzyme
MQRIALLTLEDRDDYVIDDELAITELRHRGFDAQEIPWSRSDVDWSAFDLVIVRTTWDYHLRANEFLDTLARIDASGTILENPRQLIVWNLDKRYLRDLQARNVPIVPSVWSESGTTADFAALFAQLGCDEIVIKPVVSANALDTFRLRAPLSDPQLDDLVRTFARRAWLAQPFVHTITTEGELSIFYFDGAFSHAVRKVPKSGDFRVQEEHGGSITSVSLDAEVRAVADAVIRAVTPAPFQARVDLVKLADGSLALIELEMIEPSLYFRMAAHAPSRFADAVEAVLRRHASARP